MSDLSSAVVLQPSAAQLPVEWYVSAAHFAHEQRTLFARAPRYVGHALMVPEVGDYQTLACENEGRVLVRNATQTTHSVHDGETQQGIELLSNVCRHRQAKMLDGRGHAHHIVCPLHRWTYDLHGQLLGAPHFADTPCLHLKSTPLFNWNGLLFDGKHANPCPELSALSAMVEFDFGRYVYAKTITHHCNYNWKTFIEVYLEDYHVEPFHPGLAGFVDCDKLQWQFGQQFSVQTVGVKQNLSKPGTPVYARWHEQLQRYRSARHGQAQPQHGAIWLTLYPNIMVEWYPHVLVVSTLHPTGVNRTTNVVEFYYPEEIAYFEPDFMTAQQAAYMETCAEDDEIAERMDAGRAALAARGENEVGPYQSPMEDGMLHFHEYVRAAMR